MDVCGAVPRRAAIRQPALRLTQLCADMPLCGGSAQVMDETEAELRRRNKDCTGHEHAQVPDTEYH